MLTLSAKSPTNLQSKSVVNPTGSGADYVGLAPVDKPNRKTSFKRSHPGLKPKGFQEAYFRIWWKSQTVLAINLIHINRCDFRAQKVVA